MELVKNILQQTRNYLRQLDSNEKPKAMFAEIIEDEVEHVYEGIRSIAITVYTGTAAIRINGEIINFPISGLNSTITGSSWEHKSYFKNSIKIIPGTSSKVYITYIK